MKQLLFLLTLLVALSTSSARPPNVVFIFIDDMGYGDIGPFGSTKNKTPELDRMAAEGMKLTDFYVSATACTPSRAALLTGCYADRISMDGRVCFPGEARGLNPQKSPSPRCSRRRDTPPVVSANGTSATRRSSCRWSKVSTNTKASRIRTTCGRHCKSATSLHYPT